MIVAVGDLVFSWVVYVVSCIWLVLICLLLCVLFYLIVLVVVIAGVGLFNFDNFWVEFGIGGFRWLLV